MLILKGRSIFEDKVETIIRHSDNHHIVSHKLQITVLIFTWCNLCVETSTVTQFLHLHIAFNIIPMLTTKTLDSLTMFRSWVEFNCFEIKPKDAVRRKYGITTLSLPISVLDGRLTWPQYNSLCFILSTLYYLFNRRLAPTDFWENIQPLKECWEVERNMLNTVQHPWIKLVQSL